MSSDPSVEPSELNNDVGDPGGFGLGCQDGMEGLMAGVWNS